MSGSFGTLAILCTLPQVCTKLGLTRDGRVPDLGSEPRRQEEGVRIAASGGVSDCSQSCSQFVTRSLPWVQLLVMADLGHPQAPMGRRWAEEGVEGP